MNEINEQIQALETFLALSNQGKTDATFEQMRIAEKQLEELKNEQKRLMNEAMEMFAPV